MSNEVAIIERAELMPAASVDDMRARIEAVTNLVRSIMVKDRDYGVIPGTGDKPTLLKPGAEKLCTFFGLAAEFTLVDSVKDWDRGLFYFEYRCTLRRHGMVVGEGIGSANSREKKYRWRKVMEWNATEDEKARAIRTEERTGKNNKTYKVYVIENEEPFELVNTLQKMAQKRAMVSATLVSCNASEFFNQDFDSIDPEDIGVVDAEPVDDAPAAPAMPKRRSDMKPAAAAPAPPAKPAPAKPAPAKPAAPAAGATVVRGYIARDIYSKPTAKGGQRHGIQVDGNWYNTFEQSIADQAAEAYAGGLEVEIAYTTSQYGNDITSLIVLEADQADAAQDAF